MEAVRATTHARIAKFVEIKLAGKLRYHGIQLPHLPGTPDPHRAIRTPQRFNIFIAAPGTGTNKRFAATILLYE